MDAYIDYAPNNSFSVFYLRQDKQDENYSVLSPIFAEYYVKALDSIGSFYYTKRFKNFINYNFCYFLHLLFFKYFIEASINSLKLWDNE